MYKKLLVVICVGLLSGIANAQKDPSREEVLGAIAGGALGSTIGDGDGKRIATVIGAVIGYRMGDRILNPNHREIFLDYNRNDLSYYCRGQVPFEYYYRDNLRRSWIRGCVDRLQRQQYRLEREAYEDGYKHGPAN